MRIDQPRDDDAAARINLGIAAPYEALLKTRNPPRLDDHIVIM
jgi:hypothetical protein